MKKDILHKAAVLALASMLAASVAACGKTDTKEQDAYRQYGITCLENGKYEDALTAFQNALDQSLGKVGEREIDFCFYKAKAQIASGDTEGALETYNAIIDYNKDARAYYLRGNLYFDQGKQKEACGDYEQGGESEKAKACIKEYLDSGTATTYDLYELGNNELEQKDYEEALTYFNAALAMEEVPNRQSLMKGAISAYEHSGDFASAKKMMKDYLSKYPSDEDAKRESTFLETR